MIYAVLTLMAVMTPDASRPESVKPLESQSAVSSSIVKGTSFCTSMNDFVSGFAIDL